jgi:phosphate transport system permease protein
MRTMAAPAPRLSQPASPRRRWQLREKIIEGVITGFAFTGVFAIALILLFVAKEALPLILDPEAIKEASLGKMFLPQVLKAGKPAVFVWQPVSEIPKVSLIPLLIGTLKVSAVGMLVATPLGVLAALFTSELAPRKLREWLKPAIELLAGVPSVVLGFFALMVLASVMQDTFGLPTRLNALVAGLGLALAIIPVIFTVSEDALTAVPKSYREASLALGATRWETAWRVVLPAAAPGVLAACVLGLGRAIGETMVVLMASGNAAIVSAKLTDSTRTLSATIAAEMGEVVVGSPHYSVLFFIGVQLFAITFVLNMVAGAWARRVVRRLGGKV